MHRKFLLIRFSSFFGLKLCLTFSMSAILPNLVSPLDLLRMHSVSSSSLSVKVLNNTGLAMNHLCPLLATSHQLHGINSCLSAWQPLSLLSNNTIQHNCSSLFHAHFLFLGRKKFKIPMEKGNAKRFWREVVRNRKQSPKSCLSTYNNKSKGWTILFFPEDLVTTRFCCFVGFFFIVLETFFKVALASFPQQIKLLLAQSTVKNLAQYQLFF